MSSGQLLCFFLPKFLPFLFSFWHFLAKKKWVLRLKCLFFIIVFLDAMRAFGFLCLLVLVCAAAFIYHGYSTEGSLSSNPGMVSTMSKATTSVLKSRKLKEGTGPLKPDEDIKQDHFSLEDYRPIDPVPNSKAAIRPGPIQHGTPLMPYIPNPSPSPGKPQHGP